MPASVIHSNNLPMKLEKSHTTVLAAMEAEMV